MKKMDLTHDEPRFLCRRAYDVDHDKREGDLCAYHSDEPSMTQQHFTDDANINELVRRFGITNEQIPAVQWTDQYTDLRGIPDLRAVLDQARDAKDRFMELPPKLRARFDNSMTKMWAFINDPDNAEEAVRLGLLKKIEPPAPPPAATPPTPPAPPTGSGAPPAGS